MGNFHNRQSTTAIAKNKKKVDHLEDIIAEKQMNLSRSIRDQIQRGESIKKRVSEYFSSFPESLQRFEKDALEVASRMQWRHLVYAQGDPSEHKAEDELWSQETGIAEICRIAIHLCEVGLKKGQDERFQIVLVIVHRQLTVRDKDELSVTCLKELSDHMKDCVAKSIAS